MKTPRSSAYLYSQGWLSLAALRGLQVAGLTLAMLGLAGAWLMKSEGTAGTVFLNGDGGVPQLTLLLAGRDIVYCYYHQPCKDQDQRTGLLQPPNTDTLMLVKIAQNRISVLNIPRDTNVGEYDPRQSLASQKVNSRYWSSGVEGLRAAVEEITGERVDSYVVVRADYVARVIDALGGLDVTVPAGGIEWVDKAAGVDLHLEEGKHHLTGEDAVLYLRVRKGFGDDYGRIDHQKQALTQLVDRLKKPQGLTALPTIVGGVGNGVETNLDPNLLGQLLPHLSEMKLSFATLPTDPIAGTYNLAVNRERLAQVWNPLPPTDEERTKAPVSIYTSQSELGHALAEALGQLGYEVTVKETSLNHESSQVLTSDNVQAAEELAMTLGLPRLQGERFKVPPGEVGIVLADSVSELGALRAYIKAKEIVPPSKEKE